MLTLKDKLTIGDAELGEIKRSLADISNGPGSNDAIRSTLAEAADALTAQKEYIDALRNGVMLAAARLKPFKDDYYVCQSQGKTICYDVTAAYHILQDSWQLPQELDGSSAVPFAWYGDQSRVVNSLLCVLANVVANAREFGGKKCEDRIEKILCDGGVRYLIKDVKSYGERKRDAIMYGQELENRDKPWTTDEIERHCQVPHEERDEKWNVRNAHILRGFEDMIRRCHHELRELAYGEDQISEFGGDGNTPDEVRDEIYTRESMVARILGTECNTLEDEDGEKKPTRTSRLLEFARAVAENDEVDFQHFKTSAKSMLEDIERDHAERLRQYREECGLTDEHTEDGKSGNKEE